MASLHELKRTSKRAYRRVGRGQSSTRGKTSGRGGKGQTARAGNKRRPELRDIIKKLPKRRGYGKNRARTVNVRRPKPFAISVAKLSKVFENGAEITPTLLRERGLVDARDRSPIKLIGGGGEVSKKFTVRNISMSANVRSQLEKAGGSVA